MQTTDVAIIGGGIVGLATAFRLGQRHPDLHLTILEKEPDLAHHQTGHNSGVLHSGIYYKPGSLKALNCRAGKAAMEAFCAEEDIPFELCGKVIVATNEGELPALRRILERGKANGVTCEEVGPERLAELEPHVAGIRAIHVPEAGIVDYTQVCHRLAARVERGGGTIRTQTRVLDVVPRAAELVVKTTAGDLQTRYVVNCAGLHSDRVAQLTGQAPGVQIVPFRGEYYELTPEAERFCRTLIYPVPDPAFPFLGVHFTRMISGGVECGPNAVLAFAREGYTNRTVDWYDLVETFAYRGFRRLAARYWRTGLGELWRSFSKPAFVRALQKLVPEIRAEHLVTAPAGVRAQAVTPEGTMADDFMILEQRRVVNVVNAPSPAATSSLSIAHHVVERLEAHF